MNTARPGYIPQSGSVVCHKSAVDCWSNLLHDDDNKRRVCRHTHASYCVTRRGQKGLHIPTRRCAAARVEGVDGNAVRVLWWQARFHGSLPPPAVRIVPLDYFLWGYLKDKIFEMAVPNENVLRQRITEGIRLTPSVWCAKMFWEPSSSTFCKIKSFSFLQCSVFVGCEF